MVLLMLLMRSVPLSITEAVLPQEIPLHDAPS
jgi:hypothetical protein